MKNLSHIDEEKNIPHTEKDENHMLTHKIIFFHPWSKRIRRKVWGRMRKNCGAEERRRWKKNGTTEKINFVN